MTPKRPTSTLSSSPGHLLPAVHKDRLFDAPGEHPIAFGEWCAACHSLNYAALPDWWLLFDVYDCREG